MTHIKARDQTQYGYGLDHLVGLDVSMKILVHLCLRCGPWRLAMVMGRCDGVPSGDDDDDGDIEQTEACIWIYNVFMVVTDSTD